MFELKASHRLFIIKSLGNYTTSSDIHQDFLVVENELVLGSIVPIQSVARPLVMVPESNQFYAIGIRNI